MSLDSVHSLYDVKIDSTVLGGITSASLRLGAEIIGERTGNNLHRQLASLQRAQPQGEFTTHKIAAALDEVGQLGVGIADLTSKFTMYWAAFDDGGTYQTGSNHRSDTINHGMIVPARLTCDHQGNAQIDYSVFIGYDGSNDPVVTAGSASLPTADSDDERFTIGPLTIGGVTVDHMTRLEIDFGVQMLIQSADSDIYPTLIAVAGTQPIIRATVLDAALFASGAIPLAGKAATHANTTCYLRKRSDGGTFVADGTAEHVSITAAGLAVLEDIHTAGEPGDPAQTTVRLEAQDDGTNNPLVIDTSVAIS